MTATADNERVMVEAIADFDTCPIVCAWEDTTYKPR